MTIQSLTNTILFVLFTLSMYQFSVSIAGSGVTANYVYLLIPFFSILAPLRRLVVRREVVLVIVSYSVIYLMGYPGDFFNGDSSPFRRLASFLVFVFPLFLSFVEFRTDDIRTFKRAVMLISIYYGLNSIFRFVSLIIP